MGTKGADFKREEGECLAECFNGLKWKLRA